MLFLIALGSVAHANPVVVVSDRADLAGALEVDHVEVVVEPTATLPGEQVLDRAAAAQHVAMTHGASAAVWVENNEVWVVTADGRTVRHAPIEDASNPRLFAAITASLLDELSAPPENQAQVSVDVAITPPVVAPAAADVVASVTPVEAGGRRSPIFDIAAGGFVGTRGMGFGEYPGANTTPSYPSSGVDGIALQASLFPRPETEHGDDLTGFGATFEIQRSIGATVSADDMVNDTYGNYGLDYTAWEVGAHYRHKTGRFLLDGMVSYGNATWTLAPDFPASVAVPNTEYQYIGAGVGVDFAFADHASIGVGGRYMYMLSTGDVSDMDWYGPGTATGAGLDANVKVALGGALYLRAFAEYRRVFMNFDGYGSLSAPGYSAVSDITDSWLMAGTQIGASF
ncbi:MAG TPA: hypothetical protein VGG74_11270 [Kofleriaceae bacterium]